VRTANVRIVAATNRDVRTLVDEEKIREDFYYRIAVFPIPIPPLVRRRSDLPALVQHVLRRLVERFGRDVHGVEPEVLDVFQRYDWPGNVRELENVLEYAVVVATGSHIGPGDLPDPFFARATAVLKPAGELEEDDLRAVLDRAGWNRTRAAATLGISRVTLWKRMKALGITPPEEGRSAG
jgi:transcriptional regulator with PAS, ATPase and Fis domain